MTHTSTEQPELLPCPFCGDHAETDFIPEHHSYAIECHSMGCAARFIKETAADAIAAWNRRAQASKARVPLSDEQIDEYVKNAGMRGGYAEPFARGVRWGIRHYERAHGITQEQQG